MRLYLSRIVDVWALAGGGLLLAIVLVTTVNVGGFVLDAFAKLWGARVSGLPGYEDIVMLFIGSAALMFFPKTQLEKGQVVAHFFTARLAPRVQALIDGIWHCLTGFLAMFLLYWMIQGMIQNRADGAVSRVLGWVEWYFFVPGIFSLALWAVICFAQVWETRGLIRGPQNG